MPTAGAADSTLRTRRELTASTKSTRISYRVTLTARIYDASYTCFYVYTRYTGVKLFFC